MPRDLSLGEKATVVGRAAFRTAEGAAHRNRWTRGLWQGVAAGARVLSRTAHHLFLEIIGVIFLFFAVAGAVKTYSAWQRHAGRNALLGGAVFTLLFLYFGVSSFWRTRRR